MRPNNAANGFDKGQIDTYCVVRRKKIIFIIVAEILAMLLIPARKALLLLSVCESLVGQIKRSKYKI